MSKRARLSSIFPNRACDTNGDTETLFGVYRTDMEPSDDLLRPQTPRDTNAFQKNKRMKASDTDKNEAHDDEVMRDDDTYPNTSDFEDFYGSPCHTEDSNSDMSSDEFGFYSAYTDMDGQQAINKESIQATELYRTSFAREIGDLICSFVPSMLDRVNYSIAIGKRRIMNGKSIIIEGDDQALEFVSLGSFTQPIDKVTIRRVISSSSVSKIASIVKHAKEIEFDMCLIDINMDFIVSILPIPKWKFSLCCPGESVDNVQIEHVWSCFDGLINTDSTARYIEMTPAFMFSPPVAYSTFYFTKHSERALSFMRDLVARETGGVEYDSDRYHELAYRLQRKSERFWAILAGLFILTTKRMSVLCICDYFLEKNVTLDCRCVNVHKNGGEYGPWTQIQPVMNSLSRERLYTRPTIKYDQ